MLLGIRCSLYQGLPNALDPDIYANGHAKGGSAFGPTRGTAKGKHLSSLGSTDSSNSSSSTASKAKTDDGFISLNV
jgi:hypothetical protein